MSKGRSLRPSGRWLGSAHDSGEESRPGRAWAERQGFEMYGLTEFPSQAAGCSIWHLVGHVAEIRSSFKSRSRKRISVSIYMGLRSEAVR